uniref:Peptidase A2 domain-containing protein n=1 Tax=Phytophthora ramorum TaxID=164328 RepID=H3H882_PHYRM
MVDAASDEELTIDVPTPLPDSTGNTRGRYQRAVLRLRAREHAGTSGPGHLRYPIREDVEMPTASPGGEGSQAGDGQDEESGVQYVMSNAPALPAAPKYSGSTLQEKREFMRAYQTYVHALSAFHTATTKPYIMPVSACIEERTCNLICMYELNKDPSGVSEAEWVAYFLEALNRREVPNQWTSRVRQLLVPSSVKYPLCTGRKPLSSTEQEDYTAIDEAMKSLKLKTTFPDAKSRMGQLRADMHKILDQYNTVEKTGARGEDDGTTVAHISGLPVPASLLDSGADDSLCSTTPLYPVGGGTLEVSRKVRFEEVTLETPAGPLMLRGLVC